MCDLVEDCDEPTKSKGYCNRHYLQVVFYGQEPTSRRRNNTLVRDNQGRKRCVTCGVWRPESDFHKAKNCKDGLASTCARCASEKNGARQRRNHGVTDEDFARILEEQGGRCVCGSSGPFAIDHDHSCCPGRHGCKRCVRGALCRPCNSAIAFARDDPEVLRSLAKYLEKKRRGRGRD